MFFILLLILTATSLAGVAAYFSVYGLAQLFQGMFWSVVIMGGSLEAGKLIGASYLYRYWNNINWLLKTYLIGGVLALMLLTSVGIFGMLSSGYQAQALPLKQLQQQLPAFEQERERLIERKQQIDQQIASLPKDYVKARVKLMDGFKAEQTQVTARIAELDAKVLEIKTKTIETEAHIGPITYIASAFELDTDNAAKYLIYIIIFAFDPMAVALTLAVNIALRVRREEKEREKAPKQLEPEEITGKIVEEKHPELTSSPIKEIDDWQIPDQIQQYQINNPQPIEPTPEEITETVSATGEPVVEPTMNNAVEQPSKPTSTKQPKDDGVYRFGVPRADNKLSQLLNHHNSLREQELKGVVLSPTEVRELNEIRQLLQRHGYGIYLT